MKVAAVCLGVLLCWSWASAAEDRQGRGLDQPARDRACGHPAELEAAKRALAEGDREGALIHLRRARTLVADCERNAYDPGQEGESAASAFAKAPAAGPDLLPSWTVRRKPLRESDRSLPSSRFVQPGSA